MRFLELRLRCLPALFGVMADVDALHQEENILGDISGVIGDALQIMSDEHQVHSAWNGGSLFLHEGDQLLIDSITQAINFIVGKQDVARQRDAW